jgi:hypothetical protein
MKSVQRLNVPVAERHRDSPIVAFRVKQSRICVIESDE